jgi:hypothetical protein
MVFMNRRFLRGCFAFGCQLLAESGRSLLSLLFEKSNHEAL